MTPLRALLEREVLPQFAALFSPADLVLNVGAGRHDYRSSFRCRVVTSDVAPGCDQTFPAEAMLYTNASLDGVLMVGVFERLDDPMQAMRELFRVLRPGGFLLISLLDLGFPWRKPVDRWRVSAGGVAHVVGAFTVLAEHQVADLARIFVLQKPHGGQP